VRVVLLALWLSSAPLAANTSPSIEAYLAGDYARARLDWSAQAQQGDFVASYNLGMLYLQGLGVPRESSRAEGFIRVAAVAGYAAAQYQLGVLSLSREAGADRDAATFWLTNAARQDHPMAAWYLGRVLAGEFGGAVQSEQALVWLRKAESIGIDAALATIQDVESALPGNEIDDDETDLRAGITEGRGTLAQRHAFFEGQKAFIRQDYARAVEIWAPLAEAGMARAQYGIAFMLESGWGVVQDYSEAAFWYKLAAQKGHRKAQFNLGRMYLEGRGTNADRGIGLYWVQSAADLGEPGPGS
jgi:uncharacterized protein